MAELKSIVHVYDEHGDVHVFGPGVTVPAWAKALITNPKAWSDSGESKPNVVAPAKPSGVPAAPTTEIPAKSGPKATVDAWLEYAGRHGVTVDKEATRKDIITALGVAGIPTE